MSSFRLLTESRSQTKLLKGEKAGWLTAALHLAPHKLGTGPTGKTVCPGSTPDCRATCLHFAGRSQVFPEIIQARIRRTKYLFRDPQGFFDDLCHDLRALSRAAERRKLRPAVRLNATSDLAWWPPGGPDGVLPPLPRCYSGWATLLHLFPGIQFYDYTKVFYRMLEYVNRKQRVLWPDNYALTWSHAGRVEETLEFLVAGKTTRAGTATVVFHDVGPHAPLPKTWHGFPVLDGDVNDLRFLDPPGHVIGLRPKGRKLKKVIRLRGSADFTASAMEV